MSKKEPLRLDEELVFKLQAKEEEDQKFKVAANSPNLCPT
ncbi:hypothetical protein Tco_0723113, partial [Tanacetum coccineum]